MGSSSTDTDHRVQLRRQETIADLSQQALETGAAAIDQLLDDATTAVAAALDLEYCTIVELRDNGSGAVHRAESGLETGAVGTTVPADQWKLVERTLGADEPVVDDVPADGAVPAPLSDHGVVDGAAVRIGSSDDPCDPWGAVIAYATDRPAFAEDDLAFLERIGSVLASAVENADTRRALERTERRFEAIFEDPNILVGLLEPDGTVIDINGTAMEYVAADLADVTGEPFWETPWWGEGDEIRADVREWTERAAAGEYVTFEADLTQPTGERYTIEGAFRPVTDDDGDVTSIVVSDRDVTAREERERRLSTLMDNVPGMVYRCENERGWPMEFVSDACAELTGYEPEALECGDVSWGENVMMQADRQKLWETVQRETAAEGDDCTFSETYRIETADGDRRWVRDYGRGIFDDDGDLVAIEGIIADITERKRLEADLAESEQRYRTLVEHFPNGAVALVDEDLTYRTVGGRSTDTAGATPDEIEGKPVAEAIPRSLADDLVPRYEAALEGEASAFEAEIDGRVFDFRTVPVRDDDGEVVAALGMSQDVTERYEYERELEDAKSRLEAATEAGAVGTWEWDVCEDRMVVSTTFAETFGIDPAAARDGVSLDRFLEAIHEDDRDRVERQIEAALESCGDYEAEYRIRNADNEIRWLVARGRVECDADGESVRFPGAVTDITERKRAQLQLERNNEQLETLFDVLPVGVLVADADGEILQANDTATDIWGVELAADSVDEYETYPIWWADSGERVAPEEMTLARVLDGEEVTDPDVFEIETGDGERRIIRAEGMPIRNDRGEVVRGVATITDITKRREYRRKLEESEQRYRTLIDNFPNGAVALFDEDLRYRIVGGTAFDDIDDEEETIVGKTIHDRYPPAVADRLEAKFEAALAGEPNSFEVEYHDRQWMAHTVPVTDDEGEIFGGMVMVQEITERKEHERKLRERERRLEQYKEYTDSILDAIDDVFYVIDENGDLQRWNRSVAKVTGYTDAEIADMVPADIIATEDHAAFVDAIREGLETGSTSAELTIRTKDGEPVPFEFNASRLEDPWGNTVLAGIGRDISDRKERQRRLEESERRYRTLAQHFPNGAVGVYDRDLTYTLAAGNELGETLPSADRLEGNRLPEIFPEHTVEDLEPMFWAAVNHGEIGSVETTFGGRHWRVWATPLRDADGEIFAGLSFAQDVTERVERERHLERYETIVEVVDDGVYVVDEDGYFTMVNETYAEMFGYEPDEIVGEHVSLLVDDDDILERVAELEATATSSDEWPTLEAELRTADGDTIPVEANFAMLPTDDSDWHRVGVARDISERKERERRLEESERRYRTLVENFPDGAVGLYDEDLEYIVVGGEAFDQLAVEESDVTGATLEERFSDDLVAEIEPYFRAALEGESNTFEYQAHGRDVWAHTLPVRNEDDEIFAGMIMAQDVTERREYQRKLEQSNERLERFAYAASHDLQEPLRMVTSYLQLLEKRYADAFDEDGQEFLEFAVDGAERMREMIDGLLEYSRVETRGDAFEPTDLNAVVDEVLADLQFQIEESDADIAVEDLPRLEADASQLRQVFQNLLSNAITYSGDEPPRVRVTADRRGDEWVISVEDQGIGIDPNEQDRVFTIFDRLHSRAEYDGTGIGLALCERIIERHDGEIWVDSEPGEGSTFSFALPASRDQPRDRERE